MKKLSLLIFLGLFLFSFASASILDSKDSINLRQGEKYILGDKQIEYKEIWEKYKPIEIKNWFGLGETKFKGALTKHTETCSNDCESEMEIYLANDGVLIDDVLWKRSFDNQETWVDWTGFVNWKVLVENKTNGEWINYNLGDEVEAGNYKFKIEGGKKSSTTLDWQLKTQGKVISEWAVWGSIAGGDDAEVALNSPADESIQYTSSVTTNATGNVTGGATLVNVTLYDNSTGTWENASYQFLGTPNSSNILVNSAGVVTNDGTSYITFKTFTLHDYIDRTTGTFDNPAASGTVTFRAAFNYENGTTVYSSTTSGGGTTAFNFANPHKDTNVSSINIQGKHTLPGQSFRTFDNFVYGGLIYEYASRTQTFTNTYSAGDNILWNMQFCDSDGDCGFAPSNFTFSMDTTQPTISIAAPSGTLDYGGVGRNETLNFTATDTNLDACWYDYNGTNVTIDGCQSGVSNQTNFTLESGNTNMTIWANDTVGNTNSSFINWSYKIFENSITYDNITRSGDQEDFVLNITLGSGYDLSTAVLVYDGTEYSTSIVFSGDSRIISKEDLEIPSTSVDVNNSFYFEILLADSTEINTSESLQLVRAILLDNCSTHTYRLFNISLFDEELKTPLLGDIQFNYKLLNVPSYTEINNLNLSFTNVSNTAVCSGINLTGENFVQSIEIRYTADDYVSELYHIQRAEIGENTQLNLYDLKENDSTSFKVIYQDNTFNFVEGAIIQLLRKYISEDIYEVVEAPLTSNEGVAVVHIDLDANKYKAIVVKDGVVLDTFDNLVFNCESLLTGECEQRLLGEIDPSNNVPLDTIRDFSYSLTESNNSITVTFSISSGSPAAVNVALDQKDQFGNTTLCNQTVTASAGSIECSYNDTLLESYIDFRIYKDGVPMAIKTYLIDKTSEYDFLGNNYIIVIVLLLSLVGMAMASPEWIVVNGVITMLIAGSLYLIEGTGFVIGFGSLLWIILAAGILIFKLAKQEDR